MQLKAHTGGRPSAACATYESGPGPVGFQPCHDASGSPADLPVKQRWACNATLGVISGGGHNACLNIRENVNPAKGEVTADIHAATHGCFGGSWNQPPGANMRWELNHLTAQLMSKCPKTDTHCGASPGSASQPSPTRHPPTTVASLLLVQWI